MQLFVRLVGGQSLMVNTNSNATIRDFKQHIYEQHNICIEQQNIVVYGKLCIDNYLLSYYKPETLETIHLIIK
jgi:hypothetical protein